MIPARAFVARAIDTPSFWQTSNFWRVTAADAQTGNRFCLLDQLVMPDGGGALTHTHTKDEGLYVISGHRTSRPAVAPSPTPPAPSSTCHSNEGS